MLGGDEADPAGRLGFRRADRPDARWRPGRRRAARGRRFIMWLVERPARARRCIRCAGISARSRRCFAASTMFTVAEVDAARAHPHQARRLPPVRRVASPEDHRDRRLDRLCGGIDMTTERWDTREHLDDEPLPRRAARRSRTSRGTMRPPRWPGRWRRRWATCAATLGARRRRPDRTAADRHGGLLARRARRGFRRHRGGDLAHRAGNARPATVLEIEKLYLDLIARAKRHIYAESQYFASRKIAEAIARRLDEPDGPEIVIVNPMTAQGWLEPIAMDTRARAAVRGAGAARQARAAAHVPPVDRGRRGDLRPCQDAGGRRSGAARRIVQLQQPLAAARHRMRRDDRRGARRATRRASPRSATG